jgi:hypothetical protein
VFTIKTTKKVCALLLMLLFIGTAAACNASVNPDGPAADPEQAETVNEPVDPAQITPAALEGLVESTPGGVQGGEIEAPKVEGIQYGAAYQRDLNIIPGSYLGKKLKIWTWWDMPEADVEN